jgi:hypothetical protein
LLAFGISILVFGAIILGITTSLSNVQYAKNQGLANSYAQEGMSVIRQIRDSGWSEFISYQPIPSNTYCLNQGSTKLTTASAVFSPCGTNVGSESEEKRFFSREVKLEPNNVASCCPDNTATCAISVAGSKVTVKVSWTDSKCSDPYCHKVELINCFSNIDIKPTP